MYYIVMYDKVVQNVCRYHGWWRYDDDSMVIVHITHTHTIL